MSGTGADGADGVNSGGRTPAGSGPLQAAPGGGTEVRARPVRTGRVSVVVAVLVVAVFAVIAAGLRGTSEGATFGPADRIGMLGFGVLLAAGVLLLARPSVRADAASIRVRNILGTTELPWHAVRAVSFRDGAPWATLDLVDDETLPMLAVQAVDGERAVLTLRRLRELHASRTVAEGDAAGPSAR